VVLTKAQEKSSASKRFTLQQSPRKINWIAKTLWIMKLSCLFIIAALAFTACGEIEPIPVPDGGETRVPEHATDAPPALDGESEVTDLADEEFADEALYSNIYVNMHGDHCTMFDSEMEGQDGWVVCDAVDGYLLEIYYDVYGNELLSVNNEGLGFSYSVSADCSAMSQNIGPVIEFRMFDGEAFAGIVRYKCLDEDPDDTESYGYPTKQVGEYLIVFGLDGYEYIDVQLDVSVRNGANEWAQHSADNAHSTGKMVP
jgi:hypothetical protein